MHSAKKLAFVVLGVIGALLAVFGYLDNLWVLANIGLSNRQWAAIGMVIFFGCVFALIASLHHELQLVRAGAGRENDHANQDLAARQITSSSVDLSTSKTNTSLVIHSAFYGAKGVYWDVASKLRDEIVDGKLSVPASNGMFGDPIFGPTKFLMVWYSIGNSSRIQYAAQRENLQLIIPQDAPPIVDICNFFDETLRLHRVINDVQGKLGKESIKVQELESANQKLGLQLFDVKEDRAADDKAYKELAEKSKQCRQMRGVERIFHLGFQGAISKDMTVTIRYYDRQDTEIVDTIGKIFTNFEPSPWNVAKDFSLDHVRRFDTTEARIFLRSGSLALIKSLESIFNEAHFTDKELAFGSEPSEEGVLILIYPRKP